MNIVVTGAYGAGKSSVARLLATLASAELLSADALCHAELKPGADGWQQLRALWGAEFFASDGVVDRTKVRELIFSQPERKKELEQILHPLVRKQMIARGDIASARGDNLVLEIPLFYESAGCYPCDAVLVVTADEACAVARAAARDGLDREVALRISRSQMDVAEKAQRADYVVNNGGNFAATYGQLLHFCTTRLHA